MAEERSRLLQLEPRLVLLFVLISIPMILIGSLVIFGFVRSEMSRTTGETLLAGGANDTARYLDSYLLHTVNNVSVIGTTPALREAVERANRSYTSTPEQIRENLLELDRQWVRTRGALPLSLDLVGNPASEFLRGVAVITPSYRELLVTDRQGALVAATNITTDFYQADEPWWQQAFGDGESGALYMGDVGFDTSAGHHTVELAVPLRAFDEDGPHEVIGILKALVDANELFSVIGSVERGETGHALLLDTEDGQVIVGRDPGDVMQRRYAGLPVLKEALAEGRRSAVTLQDGEQWLVGFARLPQPTPAAYRNWLVVVQQRLDEANAPVSSATTLLFVLFAGLAAMVVILSLYMHYRLVKPIREIDLREEMERLAASESTSKA